jgi:hypothetical protein
VSHKGVELGNVMMTGSGLDTMAQGE